MYLETEFKTGIGLNTENYKMLLKEVKSYLN